jgi:hypothetical protein
MADFYAEAAKILLPVLLGGLGGYGVKVRLQQREQNRKEIESWHSQKQSHWSPLLAAAHELRTRFDHLSCLLRKCGDPDGCRHDGQCRQPKPGGAPCAQPVSRESFYRDCCELYMLKREKIDSFDPLDPNAPRADPQLVQCTRRRMGHELTYTSSSVYKTARYLGLAERVRRDLAGHLLMLEGAHRQTMTSLIERVRDSLQGSGNGIFVEQQESIAEVVWHPAGGVITNFDFRQKLLAPSDWDQFTNLLRFFVHFEQKLDSEIANTSSSLADLIAELHRLCSAGSKEDYESSPARDRIGNRVRQTFGFGFRRSRYPAL